MREKIPLQLTIFLLALTIVMASDLWAVKVCALVLMFLSALAIARAARR
jgi:hypothetical protein